MDTSVIIVDSDSSDEEVCIKFYTKKYFCWRFSAFFSIQQKYCCRTIVDASANIILCEASISNLLPPITIFELCTHLATIIVSTNINDRNVPFRLLCGLYVFVFVFFLLHIFSVRLNVLFYCFFFSLISPYFKRNS